MIRTIVSFAAREAVLLLLLVVSLVPAFFLGVLADTASLQLFALSDDVAHLPLLSKAVVETVAGYVGLPMDVAVAFWLLSVISFLLAAVHSESSLVFRLRFLSAFLLIWSAFLGFVALIFAAWALPSMPLIARLDGNWLTRIVPVFIVLEVILLAGLVLFSAVRGAKSAETGRS